MAETENYGLYVEDDSSAKFIEWRKKMNGSEKSNMTIIDEVLANKASSRMVFMSPTAVSDQVEIGNVSCLLSLCGHTLHFEGELQSTSAITGTDEVIVKLDITEFGISPVFQKAYCPCQLLLDKFSVHPASFMIDYKNGTMYLYLAISGINIDANSVVRFNGTTSVISTNV